MYTFELNTLFELLKRTHEAINVISFIVFFLILDHNIDLNILKIIDKDDLNTLIPEMGIRIAFCSKMREHFGKLIINNKYMLLFNIFF